MKYLHLTLTWLVMLLVWPLCGQAQDGVRTKYNFNPGWLLHVGDAEGAEKPNYADKAWRTVTLPRASNEEDAFRVNIKDMTTHIAWYRKHFKLPKSARGKKVFVEFEGVRQGADFYLNGKHIGLHENGVSRCPHVVAQISPEPGKSCSKTELRT